jgi:hypothetical protein
MARKSRKASAPAVPELPHLTQDELLRVQLLSAQQRLAAAEAKNVRAERIAYSQKIDPQGQLAKFEQHLVELTNAEGHARAGYERLLAQIEERIGFPISQGCTIDPTTGAITRLEKQE